METVRQFVAAAGDTAPLADLHRLVVLARARESGDPVMPRSGTPCAPRCTRPSPSEDRPWRSTTCANCWGGRDVPTARRGLVGAGDDRRRVMRGCPGGSLRPRGRRVDPGPAWPRAGGDRVEAGHRPAPRGPQAPRRAATIRCCRRCRRKRGDADTVVSRLCRRDTGKPVRVPPPSLCAVSSEGRAFRNCGRGRRLGRHLRFLDGDRRPGQHRVERRLQYRRRWHNRLVEQARHPEFRGQPHLPGRQGHLHRRAPENEQLLQQHHGENGCPRSGRHGPAQPQVDAGGDSDKAPRTTTQRPSDEARWRATNLAPVSHVRHVPCRSPATRPIRAKSSTSTSNRSATPATSSGAMARVHAPASDRDDSSGEVAALAMP